MSEAWGILVLVLLGYAVYRLWQIENQLWRIGSQLRRIEEYVRVIAARPKPPEDDESPICWSHRRRTMRTLLRPVVC